MTSADQITRDPQNPYKSFLVNASAGTGKTYQLSHRFLHLIAAHADPSKVLAVTFTVKAGQEMQERILGEAQNLLHSPEDREAFDLKAKEFWNALPAGHTVTEPLTASAAALLILQHSSNLQIQTLDSLMSQWLRTFGRLSQIETGDIGSEDQLYALYKEAFQEMLENLNQQKLLQVAATTFPDKGVQEILPRLEALHATKLGPLAVVKDAKNEKPFPPFEIQVIKDGYGKYLTPTGIKVFDELPDKLEGKSQATALLTLKKTLKTQLFKSRGAALDRDQPLFRDELEKWCQQTLALEQKKSLAAKHKLLSAIHTMFQGKLQDKKNAKGLWDFVDIETETARLISNPELSGIHYFLMGQVQHLLVDEFQDTSSSQWQVLKPLAEELLSGQGTTEGFPPTVFLVGDPKQSIYGFRGALPELMTGSALANLALSEVHLTKSYRSSQVILDAANAVFPGLLGDLYRPHQAAGLQPNCGQVLEAVKTTVNSEKDDVLSEPERLAKNIAAMLADPEKNPVWDKNAGEFRPATPGDVAILLWAKTRGEQYIAALEELGIPCEFWDGGAPLLEMPEIRDLEQLLRLCIFPRDGLAAWSVLSSHLFAVPVSALADAWQQCLESKEQKENQQEKTGDTPSFAELTAKIDEQTPWAPDKKQRIDAITQALESANASEANNSSYTQLWTARGFWALLQKLDWISSYQNAFAAKGQDLTAVQTAANARMFCQGLFELERKVDEPYEILDQIKSYRTMGIAWLRKSNASPGASRVRVMSIHKSKGLEFPIVCIPELGRDWYRPDAYWVKTSRGPDNQGLPTAVRYIGSKKENSFMQQDPDVQAAQVSSQQEKARLFYVAWTRARQYLLLSWDKEAFFAKELTQSDASANSVFMRADDTGGHNLEFTQTNESKEEEKKEERGMGATQRLRAIWKPASGNQPLWIRTPASAGLHRTTQEVPRSDAPELLESAVAPDSLDHARLAGIWLHQFLEGKLKNKHTVDAAALWQNTLKTQEPNLWNWLQLGSLARESLPWYPEDTPDRLHRTFLTIQEDARKTWEATFWQDLLASAEAIHCERSLQGYNPAKHQYTRAQCDLWIDFKPHEKRSGIWADVDADALIADFKSTHAVQKLNPPQRKAYAEHSGAAEQIRIYQRIAKSAVKEKAPSNEPSAQKRIAAAVIWSALPACDIL